MFKKDSKSTVFIEYTILFLIVAFFISFWFVFEGRTLLWQTDGFKQQYPIVVHIRHTCGELLRGHGFSFWSWSIGLGADRIGNFPSFYLDPFTYVMAAFPPSTMDIGYSIAILLRMYAAGFTMILYLRSIKLERYQCLIGALSYCFCLWAYACFMQMMFYIPMIVFPLLIMGIDEVDRSGRPFKLILTVAYLLSSNAYFAFMMAIVSGTYSIVKYFFLDRKKSPVDFLKRFGLLFVYVCLGALLAAPILAINIIVLAHSPKGGESFVPSLFYQTRQIFLFVPSFFTDQQFMENYSAMSICGIVLAMFPAIILNIRNKKLSHVKMLSVMFLVCLIFLAFPIFGSIMNGYNYTQARWAFMFQFFFSAAAVETLSVPTFEDKDYQKSYLRGLSIFIVVIVFCMGVGEFFKLFNTGQLYVAFINIGVMFATVCILFGYSGKEKLLKRGSKLVLLCVAGLSFFYFMKFSKAMTNGYYGDRMKAGEAYKTYQNSILRNAKNFDEDFYRIDVNNHVYFSNKGYASEYHAVANDNLYFDTPTVYYFVSTMDSCMYDFYSTVGNNDGTTLRVSSYSNDGRTRLDFLQNVQYIATVPDDKDKVRNYAYSEESKLGNKDRVILKNRWDVALGYVYSDYITESEYMEQDYLGREQMLMQAAVVTDDYSGTASHVATDKLNNDTKELSYVIESADGVTLEGNTLKVSKAKARMTLRFEDVKDSELYILLENFDRIPVTYEELKEQKLNDDSTPKERFLFGYNNLFYQPSENFEIFVEKDSRREKFIDYTGTNNVAVAATTDYLKNIGYYKEAEGTLTLQFNTVGSYSLDAIKIFTVSEEHFDEQADRLESNRLVVTEVGNDYVKGTVDSDGGILYLSILNSGGWKAYVDGKKVDLRKVNIGYIGLDVEPGQHTIELKYMPVGWPIAWFFTLIGVAGVAGFVIFFRVKGKKSMPESLGGKETEDDSEQNFTEEITKTEYSEIEPKEDVAVQMVSESTEDVLGNIHDTSILE